MLQHLGQRGTGGGGVLTVGGTGPAEPKVLPRHSQRLVEADTLAQHLVGKAVGQFCAVLHHHVTIGMGQQPLVAGRLGCTLLCEANT